MNWATWWKRKGKKTALFATFRNYPATRSFLDGHPVEEEAQYRLQQLYNYILKSNIQLLNLCNYKYCDLKLEKKSVKMALVYLVLKHALMVAWPNPFPSTGCQAVHHVVWNNLAWQHLTTVICPDPKLDHDKTYKAVPAPPSQKSSKRHRIWCHSPAFPPEMSQHIMNPHTYAQNFADSSFMMLHDLHAISNCRNNISLCPVLQPKSDILWSNSFLPIANSLHSHLTGWDKAQAFTVAAQLNESGSSASSACIASNRSNAT